MKIDAIPIKEVRINEHALKNIQFHPTLINFFYGKNGSGKTSIGKHLKDHNPSDKELCLFNDDYIKRNIQQYGSMPGVFTITEEDAEAKKQIDAERQKQKDATAKKDDLLKQKSEAEGALEKFKRNGRKDLRNAIKPWTDKYPKIVYRGITSPNSQVEHILNDVVGEDADLKELEQRYAVAFDESVKTYPKLSFLGTFVGSKDQLDLIGTPVISSADTPFAQFIKKLNAFDWVRTGYRMYQPNADGVCPYCQRPLTDKIKEQIEQCFDETYQEQVSVLNRFKIEFEAKKNAIESTISANSGSEFQSDRVKALQSKCDTLIEKMKNCLSALETKIKEPARIVDFELPNALIEEINGICAEINKEIQQHNDLVAVNDKKKCQEAFWKYIAFKISSLIAAYQKGESTFKKQIKDIEVKIKAEEDKYKAAEAKIRALNTTTSNTDDAKDNINAILKATGFHGFYLENSEEPNTYILKRPGEDGPAKGLSEGERNYIAFLYFYQYVIGTNDKAGKQKEKIIVIDDPVSSMDSSTMYMISMYVRNLLKIAYNRFDLDAPDDAPMFIDQIFVLTHNPYFFKEVTFDYIKEYECVKVYTLNKNADDTTSLVKDERDLRGSEQKENFSPVRNTYDDMWQELKEVNDPVILLHDMRRILQYYFVQISGRPDLREELTSEDSKTYFGGDEKMQLVQHMVPLFDLESRGINDELYFDAASLNPDLLREVFRGVFDVMHQRPHYDMMMNE
jgi:wobble nucleotide-excising tRNase